MKQIILVISILFVCSNLKAQDVGVRAGFNLAGVRGDVTDSGNILGFYAGPFFEFGLTPGVDLDVSFLFNRRGFSDEMNEDLKIDYIDLPVLLKFNIAVFNIQAGPYFSYLFAADYQGMSFKEILKSADYGGIIGAGANFGNLGAEIRYSVGFANINDIDEETIKNGSFSAGITVKF